MKYLNYYKDRTEIKSEMYDNKPFVTYVEKDNTVFYDNNSVKIPDSLKSKIRALWIADGKSNEDSDRNIIIDRSGNDHNLELSGFSFSKNSGYGKYELDFTEWIQTNGVITTSDKVQNSIIGRFLYFNAVNKKDDVPSFKVNITLGQHSKLQYNYIKEDGTGTCIVYSESGIYTIPASYFSKYTGGNAWFGFYQIEGTSIIEQIPEFQGAVVTDGVDDIIKSSNTISEILGDSSKCTVLSMMVNLDDKVSNSVNILGSRYLRNIIKADKSGKYGILGYSSSNINTLGTIDIINNILGDNNDYSASYVSAGNVQDYFFVDGHLTLSGDPVQVRSKAWYWSLIANDELTSNEINLLIQYYDLDRWIRPIAYYNPKRQGLTNGNHTEFNDKLLDLSGNGYDIKLNNMSWSLGSGIGKYSSHCNEWFWVSNGNDNNDNNINGYVTSTEVKIYGISSSIPIGGGIKDGCRLTRCLGNTESLLSMTIKVSGISKNNVKLSYDYCNDNSIKSIEIINDGIYNLPESVVTPSINNWMGLYLKDFLNNLFTNPIIIEIIPDNKDALVLDGIDDYGNTEVNIPELKDYTIISDRQWLTLIMDGGGIISKTDQDSHGAFILEQGAYDNKRVSTWSFGELFTKLNGKFLDRNVIYQSKYSYCNNDLPLSVNASDTSRPLFLGKIRNSDSRYSNVAIYYILLYPYSMSKFLMNRQLEKYNLRKLN